MYQGYPDPMPRFEYIGGDQGRGLLESALAAPRHTYDQRFLHKTIFDKAAALFRSLVKNHPLVDGNKRLALTCVTVFLTMNGYLFFVPKDEAVQYTLCLATAEGTVNLKEVSSWLRRNSIKFDRLKRIQNIIGGSAPFGQKALGVLIQTYEGPIND